MSREDSLRNPALLMIQRIILPISDSECIFRSLPARLPPCAHAPSKRECMLKSGILYRAYMAPGRFARNELDRLWGIIFLGVWRWGRGKRASGCASARSS
jgi:hypothetical protein